MCCVIVKIVTSYVLLNMQMHQFRGKTDIYLNETLTDSFSVKSFNHLSVNVVLLFYGEDTFLYVLREKSLKLASRAEP